MIDYQEEKAQAKNVYYTTSNPGIPSTIGGDDYAIPVKGKKYLTPERETSFYGDAWILKKGEHTASFSMEKCSIKNVAGFGGDVELANIALAEWRKLGYKGSPYSCASFCRETFNKMKSTGDIVSRCNASANNSIRDYFTGGWIESRYRGYIYDPVYHYDINQAYLSAGFKGLPSRLYPYNGDPDALGYVVVMDLMNQRKGLPNFFDYDRVLATSEDVKRYGLRGKVVRGVQFYDLNVNLGDLLWQLVDLPYTIFKRCTQSYWGMFASTSGIEIEDLETKESRRLWNRYQNITWASLIVRRVAGEVWDVMKKHDGISCFVDSVLTTEKIEGDLIGSDTGQWKEAGFYDKGIYIDAAGVWNPLPFKKKSQIKQKRTWKKHAGTANR